MDSPIDQIYVAGPEAARFSPAERIGTAEPEPGGSGLQVFGSDHYPLVAVLDR